MVTEPWQKDKPYIIWHLWCKATNYNKAETKSGIPSQGTKVDFDLMTQNQQVQHKAWHPLQVAKVNLELRTSNPK